MFAILFVVLMLWVVKHFCNSDLQIMLSFSFKFCCIDFIIWNYLLEWIVHVTLPPTWSLYKIIYFFKQKQMQIINFSKTKNLVRQKSSHWTIYFDEFYFQIIPTVRHTSKRNQDFKRNMKYDIKPENCISKPK